MSEPGAARRVAGHTKTNKGGGGADIGGKGKIGIEVWHGKKEEKRRQ